MELLQGCDVCGEDHRTELCPELGLDQSQVPLDQLSTRARLTLPPFLEVVDNGQGLVGVVAKETIAKKKQLGPYEAKRTTHIFEDNGYFTLKLIGKDGTMVCLDTTDENECNWLCLVRCAMSDHGQNCMAYQVGANLYYNTTREISAGEELQVWYATHYAKKLGKPATPDGITRVLLGHSIEPLAEPLTPSTDVKTADPTSDPNNSNLDNSHNGDDVSLLQQDPVRDVARTTGEIRKAHWCPRCGHTFSSRTDMVQHLRQHVLNAAAPKDKDGTPMRRGRGRPRIFPPKDAGEPKTPGKRGRPRKDKQQRSGRDSSGDEDDDFSGQVVNRVPESPEMKRIKLDIVGNDENYSPKAEILNSASRILPKRKSRGHHSKLFEDYVVGNVGKFQTDDEEKGDGQNKKTTEVRKNTKITVIKIVDTPTQSTAKRPRGRPKKAKRQENEVIYLDSENILKDKSHHGKKQPLIVTQSPSENNKILVQDKGQGREKQSLIVPQSSNEILEPGQIEENERNTCKSVDKPDIELVNVAAEESSGDILETADSRIESNGYSDEISDAIKLQISDTESSNDARNIAEAFQEIQEAAKVCNKNLERSNSETVMGDDELNPELMVIDARDITGDITHLVEDAIKEFDGTMDIDSTEDGTMDIADTPKDGMAETGGVGSTMTGSEVVTASEECQADLNDVDNTSGVAAKDKKLSKASKPAIKGKTKRKKVDVEKYMYVVTNDDGTQLYACKACDKRYATRAYLRLHIPKHSGQYNCTVCSKTFTRKDSLLKHICQGSTLFLEKPLEEIVEIITVDGKDIYRCLQCESVCNEEIDALSHYMDHRDVASKLACGECNKLFPDEECLADHECTKQDTEAHKCDICHQGFKTAQYLYRHMVMHTDYFKCVKCSKTFARKDSLQKHILRCCPKLSESYKIYSCEVCCRVFSTKSGKINHKFKCKAAKCSTCKRVFGSKQDLEMHTCNELDVAEKNSVEFSCGECGKSFSSQYYMNRHRELHKNKFKCSICHKALPSQDDVREHEIICKPVSMIRSQTGGRAKCDKCDEEFTSSKKFREHYQTHTHPYQCNVCLKRFIKVGSLNEHKCGGNEEHQLCCPVCDRQFTSERFLAKHLESHGPVKYTCDMCKQDFTSKKKYHKHVCKLEDGTHAKILQNKSGRQVIEQLVCEVCGRDFVNRSNLTKHLLLHGEKKYKCPHCGKRFHHYTYVNEHVNCVHYNIFKFQCNTCGKMLKSKTGLMVHTKQFHMEGGETYPCEKCGKVFKQKGNLRTHMYSHLSERKFVCEFCNKSWKYPDQLSRHKLTHTMVNKLSCPHCDKKFCKTYELKRHVQVFHSGNVYVCGVCFSRCGHRHTLVRHYKRKHPESFHLLSVDGYIDSMLKQFDEIGEFTRAPKKSTSQGTNTKTVGTVWKNADGTLILDMNAPTLEKSQTAAKALHCLSNATATAQQLALLRESGILKGDSLRNLITSGLIPSDRMVGFPANYEVEDNNTAGTSEETAGGEMVAISNGTETDNNINMVTNSDGSISINGVQHVPRSVEAIENADGQMLILQIVDLDCPESGQTDQVASTDHLAGEGGEIIQIGDIQHMDSTQQGQIIQQTDITQEEQFNPNEIQIQGQVIQTASTNVRGQIIQTASTNVRGQIIQINNPGAQDIQQADFNHLNLFQKGDISQKGQIIEQETIGNEQIVTRNDINQGQIILQDDGQFTQLMEQGQIIQQEHFHGGQLIQQGQIIEQQTEAEGQITQHLAAQQEQIIQHDGTDQQQFMEQEAFDLQDQLLQQELANQGQAIQELTNQGHAMQELTNQGHAMQELANQGDAVQQLANQGQEMQELANQEQAIEQVETNASTVYESMINIGMQKLGEGEVIYVQGDGEDIHNHRVAIPDGIV